ncbi:MAG TPA: cation-translocating P-type ATPase [Anaerolineae bacterium]|nr:cation-translocating P-type ATPase [Anaerolineae bacterium]
MKAGTIWNNLEIKEVLSSLQSTPKGLSQEEAERRLVEYGPNELQKKKRVPPWVLFLEQFKNFLVIILLIAAIISGALAAWGEGDVWDPILIVIIILFATILGFAQEFRSEKALEALKKMTAHTAAVIRSGKEKKIPGREIVPGDIILLRTGDRVPADSRLFEAVNLKTNEAALTGESVSSEKNSDVVSGDVPAGDRKNMVHMGTTVVYGRGKAIVTGIGMATEFGHIADMLQEVKTPPTPLQISLDKIGKALGFACLVICLILAVAGIVIGIFDNILNAFIWGVSLAVAAVPEALPAVVTITLAIGVQRMAKRHALMRRLPAVETLGCTDFICSDKTGTLTQDQMTVKKLYVGNRIIDVTGAGYEPKGDFYLHGNSYDPRQDHHLQRLMQINVLCNDSQLVTVDGAWQIKGDPTEGALAVAAAKAGIEQGSLINQFTRINEIPFSSERKRMTTIHNALKGWMACSKGAPEVILNSCDRIYIDEQERGLTEQDRRQILEINKQMAEQALRVLGMAYKPLSGDELAEEAEKGMVFAGLAGMIDPPREEVKEAIGLCDQAGIRSVMITGDHKLTAMAIARELGLLKDNAIAISGRELDELSDDELDKVVEEIRVYARVSPAHKMRVVGALQKKGHVVAMTGDGVNDAPALKKADIGIAMGITGTDVSKETAAMVLADDNYASIVAAVEEGRGVYDNIKKFLMYLLSSNLGEILLMTSVILFGSLSMLGIPRGTLPLIAVQILWVNLVTDGLPALALAVDPMSPDIMKQRPRRRQEGIFNSRVITLIAIGGVWSCIINVGIFSWALEAGKNIIEAQSLVFMTLIFIQFFKAVNYRSDRLSIFEIGIFTNKWLGWAILASFAMCIPLFYIPFFQDRFHTFPLSLPDWTIVILSSATIFIVLEIAKLVIRRLEKEFTEVTP